jgi:hypothetical protein
LNPYLTTLQAFGTKRWPLDGAMMGCYDKLLMVEVETCRQKEGGDKNKAQPQMPRIPVAGSSFLRMWLPDVHSDLTCIRKHFY